MHELFIMITLNQSVINVRHFETHTKGRQFEYIARTVAFLQHISSKSMDDLPTLVGK